MYYHLPMAPTMSVDAPRQQELEDALNEVAGHLNAQHGRLVDLVIEMLAHETAWCGPGVHTPSCSLPGASACPLRGRARS